MLPLLYYKDYKDDGLLSRSHSQFMREKEERGFPVLGDTAIVPLLGKLLGVVLVIGAVAQAKENKDSNAGGSVAITVTTAMTTLFG